MRYAAVMVNWNGAADTLASLDSIFDGSDNARVIVVDNGSTDRSIERIVESLDARRIVLARMPADDLSCPVELARVVLVEAGENLGFAAGANLGLRVAAIWGSRVTVFLNNDTIVEGDALDRIARRLVAESDCFACLPMLMVQGTDRIWNCGGEVYRVGLRRYHLAGRSRQHGQRRAEIRCSFFTGCCFAVRTGEFVQRHGFTERFFFGEEDFELALWMKDRERSAVCLTSAVVQHKVSASFSEAAGTWQAAKSFIYYLNRFIHMRLRFGTALWWLWIAAYLPYCALLLWRSGTVRLRGLAAFFGPLVSRARVMDRVTREDFEAVMTGRISP